MTVKKNVFFVVVKNFINMVEEDENVPSVEEPLESTTVSLLNAGEVLKNGFWTGQH